MRLAGSGRMGFSFIEVIAILFILGVLAVAVVSGTSRIGAGPSAEAARMRSHLRYAQSLALANNTADWGVQINANSYQLLRNGQPSALSFPGERGSTRMLASGVTVSGGTGLLTFDALGAPAETHNIVISGNGMNETVKILGFTGMIP